MWTFLPAVLQQSGGGSPPDPTALPLDDTFSSDALLSAHTADTGQTWSLVPAAELNICDVEGDLDIAGGLAGLPEGGGCGELYSTIVLGGSYHLIVDMEITTANTLTRLMFACQRDADFTDYLQLDYYHGFDGSSFAATNFHVVYTDTGNFANTQFYDSTGGATDGAHTLEFIVTPTTADVRLDGVTRISGVHAAKTDTQFDMAVKAASGDSSIALARVRVQALGGLATFTGANGTKLDAYTSEDGSGWILGQQNDYTNTDGPLIDSNTASINGLVGLYGAFSTATPASANYAVDAAIKAPDSATENFAAIQLHARVANAASTSAWVEGYFVELAYNSTDGWTLKLWKQTSGGSSTQLGSTYNPSAPGSGSAHALRLELNGSSLVVKWDNASVISTTDSTYAAAGAYGFALTGTWVGAVDKMTVTYL